MRSWKAWKHSLLCCLLANSMSGVSKETGIKDGFMGLDCGPKSIEENAAATRL